MNSRERHEARYERRKDKRKKRLEARCASVGTLEDVFTFSDLFRMGIECCNGVRWKASVQNFEIHLFSNTARNRSELLSGTWEPSKYNSFKLTERGKTRPIDAPRIRDRQVHKVLTRKVLIPLYSHLLINDNGASLRDKGFHFALRTLEEQLRGHFRKYGREGWVILMDFERFFPSASHSLLKRRHERYILDEGLRKLTDRILETDGRREGIPLGVEVSQIEMVASPSGVDSFMRSQLSLGRSGHYMDDYHIFVPPDKDPDEILDALIGKAAEEGFIINRPKTRVIPLTQRFKYCKATFNITPSGRIYKAGAMRSFRVARRKIKMFARRRAEGPVNEASMRCALQSSLSYFRNYDNHGKYLRLRRMCHAVLEA